MVADFSTCGVIRGEVTSAARLIRWHHPHTRTGGPAVVPAPLQGTTNAVNHSEDQTQFLMWQNVTCTKQLNQKCSKCNLPTVLIMKHIPNEAFWSWHLMSHQETALGQFQYGFTLINLVLSHFTDIHNISYSLIAFWAWNTTFEIN